MISTRPNPVARPARRGFTLVEIMAVIMILGLTVTAVSYNWKRIVPRAQLNAAVRELSNVLHSTRSESITRNAEFRVIYDLTEGRYWVETPYRVGGGLAVIRIPGEEDPDEEVRATTRETELGTGVKFSRVQIDGEDYYEGQVYVRFTPSGSSSAHTIELYHEPSDASYTIEVLPLTGLIRFHTGIFEREEPDEGDFR